MNKNLILCIFCTVFLGCTLVTKPEADTTLIIDVSKFDNIGIEIIYDVNSLKSSNIFYNEYVKLDTMRVSVENGKGKYFLYKGRKPYEISYSNPSDSLFTTVFVPEGKNLKFNFYHKGSIIDSFYSDLNNKKTYLVNPVKSNKFLMTYKIYCSTGMCLNAKKEIKEFYNGNLIDVSKVDFFGQIPEELYVERKEGKSSIRYYSLLNRI